MSRKPTQRQRRRTPDVESRTEHSDSTESRSRDAELDDAAAHTESGPYYIAPDSAEPWPQGVWEDLDYEQLQTAAERLAQFTSKAVEEEPESLVAANGFSSPKEDRDLLERIGWKISTES